MIDLGQLFSIDYKIEAFVGRDSTGGKERRYDHIFFIIMIIKQEGKVLIISILLFLWQKNESWEENNGNMEEKKRKRKNRLHLHNAIMFFTWFVAITVAPTHS